MLKDLKINLIQFRDMKKHCLFKRKLPRGNISSYPGNILDCYRVLWFNIQGDPKILTFERLIKQKVL